MLLIDQLNTVNGTTNREESNRTQRGIKHTAPTTKQQPEESRRPEQF